MTKTRSWHRTTLDDGTSSISASVRIRKSLRCGPRWYQSTGIQEETVWVTAWFGDARSHFGCNPQGETMWYTQRTASKIERNNLCTYGQFKDILEEQSARTSSRTTSCRQTAQSCSTTLGIQNLRTASKHVVLHLMIQLQKRKTGPFVDPILDAKLMNVQAFGR